MDAFIFAADCHCAACGEMIRRNLTSQGKAPADIDAESTYDSDAFPKGPYAEGGGESDTPQHCGTCGLFLENPLTQDGYAYLREQVATRYDVPAPEVDEGADEYAARLADGLRLIDRPALVDWVTYYPEAYSTANGGPL